MYHRFKWTRASHRRNGISQEYEPVQPYFLLALIKATNCKTFVDVGANIGAYSVLMSEAVDNVIAFEANANAANEMARNLSVNNLQAQIIRKAASSRNGTVSFGTVSRLAGNSAVVATSAGQNFRQTSELESVTLDAILSEQAEPFAIKIDVEGHEKEVLAGATRTLSRRCVIQIEDHKGTLELEHFRLLARIGPDAYFSNIDGIEVARIFEDACASLIRANHENKSASLRFGPFGISIHGAPYRIVRFLAVKLLGSRL